MICKILGTTLVAIGIFLLWLFWPILTGKEFPS
jgi:hypothetical protein